MKLIANKRFLAVLIFASLIIAAIPVLAMASPSEPENSPTLADYQAIIDDINAEFGTDFHFFTPEEIAELNLPIISINELGTLAEYESELRNEAEAVVAETEAAEIASALAAQQPGIHRGPTPMSREPIIENGEIIGDNYFMNSVSLRTSAS